MQWFGSMYSGWKKTGVDVAFEAVSAARSAGHSAMVGSATALPVDSESADLVITLDVLQHLPLPDGDSAALAEMQRALRPGGALFVRTNCQSYPRTPDDTAYEFRKYEPAQLKSKLRSAGFDVLLISRVNAMLGFAEIGREIRATKKDGAGYHGILAVPSRSDGLAFAAKRATLRAEGRLIAAGATLPFGRSIVALCRKERAS
jgi:SAM-dependent methyltransferase